MNVTTDRADWAGSFFKMRELEAMVKDSDVHVVAKVTGFEATVATIRVDLARCVAEVPDFEKVWKEKDKTIPQFAPPPAV